jgi:hypothetical protein
VAAQIPGAVAAGGVAVDPPPETELFMHIPTAQKATHTPAAVRT